MEDFRKLVDVKAYTKVGLFYPPLSRKEETLDALSEHIAFSGIKNPLEKYLLILMVDHGVKTDPKIRVEVSTYHIDITGERKKLGEIRVD